MFTIQILHFDGTESSNRPKQSPHDSFDCIQKYIFLECFSDIRAPILKTVLHRSFLGLNDSPVNISKSALRVHLKESIPRVDSFVNGTLPSCSAFCLHKQHGHCLSKIISEYCLRFYSLTQNTDSVFLVRKK